MKDEEQIKPKEKWKSPSVNTVIKICKEEKDYVCNFWSIKRFP